MIEKTKMLILARRFEQFFEQVSFTWERTCSFLQY